MRAVAYTRPGDPSVLELVERPTPEPDADEIRIRLLVSGVPDRLEVAQRRDRRAGRGADGSEP
jgi:NADPH:quinone reductase-like Zn-dependent oxidoreductase